jgi:hypothetical protein
MEVEFSLPLPGVEVISGFAERLRRLGRGLPVAGASLDLIWLAGRWSNGHLCPFGKGGSGVEHDDAVLNMTGKRHGCFWDVRQQRKGRQ